MTIYQAQQALLQTLVSIYDERESVQITDWVMEHITGWKKTDRLLNKQTPITPEQQQLFDRIQKELTAYRPVQYVLGEAWFMGMKFFVDESVLIPRPETEELVEWVIESTSNEVRSTNTEKQVSILDIGTGSGCIPVSLKKKLPEASVTSIDISAKALEVASRNAAYMQVDINFVNGDFLKEANWHTLPFFDVIVSNPPYIKQSEQSAMAKHVTDFEPSEALFVPDNDALIFYRMIALFAKTHLNNGGSIFLEINETLGAETTSLFNNYGFEVELRKDLQGKDRMLKVIRK